MSANPGNITPVYDSVCKKHETTRRTIFKDNNGKYKEKLEIKNCEKRTLFGSLPFDGSAKWKRDDLSNIVGGDQEISKGQKDDDQKNVYKHTNASSFNSAEVIESGFKDTLKKIIDKLNDDRMTDAQGVKKIFEKKRISNAYGVSNDSTGSDSHVK